MTLVTRCHVCLADSWRPSLTLACAHTTCTKPACNLMDLTLCCSRTVKKHGQSRIAHVPNLHVFLRKGVCTNAKELMSEQHISDLAQQTNTTQHTKALAESSVHDIICQFQQQGAPLHTQNNRCCEPHSQPLSDSPFAALSTWRASSGAPAEAASCHPGRAGPGRAAPGSARRAPPSAYACPLLLHIQVPRAFVGGM